MAINEEQRLKIRAKLLNGDLSLIARKINVSRTAVSRWFKGRDSSRLIEMAVLDLLEERVKQDWEITERVNRLLSE